MFDILVMVKDDALTIIQGSRTSTHMVARNATVPEIVLTSLRLRPSGQATAEEKERPKETAEEAVLSSTDRPSRRKEDRASKAKENALAKNGFSGQRHSFCEYPQL